MFLALVEGTDMLPSWLMGLIKPACLGVVAHGPVYEQSDQVVCSEDSLWVAIACFHVQDPAGPDFA